MVGLRERKKQRTRRALIEAAFRLFEEKGFEETTLAEIAAAADVSTRTFFSYFASKEDVLFYDVGARVELAMSLLAGRTAEDSPADVLIKLIDESMRMADTSEELTYEYADLRTRLILTVPSLQAKGLLLLFDTQLKLARALHGAYPDRLSPTEAAAAVGAVVGAVKLAIIADLDNCRSLRDIWDTGRRAAEVTLAGLRSLG